MTIPVYVVGGFLGTGKSTLINLISNSRDHIGVISFERGSTNLATEDILYIPPFTRDELDSGDVVNRIKEYIIHRPYSELWIEWNGMSSLQDLECLFLGPPLRGLCHIEHIIYTINDHFFKYMLPGLAHIHLPFIESANHIVLCSHLQKSSSTKEDIDSLHLIKKAIQPLNSSCTFYTFQSLIDHAGKPSTTIHKLVKKTRSRLLSYKTLCTSMGCIGIIALLHLWFGPIDYATIYKMVLYTCAILLQMFPFFTLGIIISSLVSLYISNQVLERLLRGSVWKGYFFSLIGAITIPLCDCAAIPLLRTLLKKKIPFRVCLFFILVSPILNPISLLATYYAFNSNVSFLLFRSILGIMTAGITSYLIGRQKLTHVMVDTYLPRRLSPVTSKKEAFSNHVKEEFFRIFPYLIFGAFVSALSQTFGSRITINYEAFTSIISSILYMEGLAFILSICSSSDAIVGRVIGMYTPLAATLGFLLIGPMIDIKNFFLYQSIFTKKFVMYLSFYLFLISTILCVFVHYIGVINL